MRKVFLAVLAVAMGLVLVLSPRVLAGSLEDKQAEIEELEKKISQLQGEQKTLSSLSISPTKTCPSGEDILSYQGVFISLLPI